MILQSLITHICSGAKGCYLRAVDMLQMGAMLPAYFPNGSFGFHPELRKSSFRQSLPEL